MRAALAAALIAAVLSLGGASLVVAGQPAGQGSDNTPSENANSHATEQAPAPAAAPASTDAKANRGQSKKQAAPTQAATRQKQAKPVKTTAPATSGGSHSTATTGPGNSAQGCDGSHNSDTGHGANHSGPYDNTCDGSPSGNGNGNGRATGKPCAGCVGNADDKNPKGQYPNGSDHNAGYECDRNHGIGRTNPAHTGCQSAPSTSTPAAAAPSKSKDHPCAGSSPLAAALKQSAAVVLEAVAKVHPGLAKQIAKLTTAASAGACTQPAAGSEHQHGEITICHATGSATNPYVEITISVNGLHGHAKHQDGRDIIPAPAEGCPAASATTPPAAGSNGKTRHPGQVAAPQLNTETPAPAPTTPASGVLGTTDSGQPATPATPGEQALLGAREAAPAHGTSPDQSRVLGEYVAGSSPSSASAPLAAASAPAAALAARPAPSAKGSLPFTGTDALLVLFLGCLTLLAGVAIQRLVVTRGSN